MAMGFFRLPLFALGLALAAVLFWPRKRKVQKLLQIETRKPLWHWGFLMLAFFALPIGSYKVPNMFYVPEAPQGDLARHILERALSNTYHAFNLTDEDALYDRLSESVSGDLIANIYLDNRRKLTSGVQKGAKVTVREVRVLSIGSSVEGKNAVEGYAYECKWAVTARVSHLQHIHYRQNIYSGIVTIRTGGENWKISRIALASEDRVIIPWSSG
jgi:hypothetical protein